MSDEVPLQEFEDETVPVPDRSIGELKARRLRHASPRVLVVIAHGFGEHGGCYGHVAGPLRRTLDAEILAFDFRGHGRSPGRRGYVEHYDRFIDDLSAAVERFAKGRESLPLFVIGHSNGGLVSLLACLSERIAPRGLVVSNPALKVKGPVPGWKVLLGRVLRLLAPKVTLGTGVGHGVLTRDDSLVPAREADTLRHGRISAEAYFGMRDAGLAFAERASSFRVPVLWILGAADPLIDAEFGEAVFRSLGSADKTIKIYPDVVHEPFNDLGREQAIGDVVAWIRDRVE